MFCQTCGTQLRPTAHFCNHCGKPVEERFGTALLHARKPGTAEVKPGQTAEQLLDSAPTTPELSPKPPTDQIAQRGTDRQPLAKTTGPEENAAVERATDFIGTPPGAITNVSSQLPGHFSANAQPVPEPSPQQSFGAVSHAVTQVEDETLAAAPSALALGKLIGQALAKLPGIGG